jgi:phospholipid transport system transporter-binding protein
MPDDAPFRVRGALTKDEVPALWRDTSSWRSGAIPSTIDLGGVEQADASGVALLLEWSAWARARGETIAFENAPEGLRTIAALSQVDALLGFEETSSA